MERGPSQNAARHCYKSPTRLRKKGEVAVAVERHGSFRATLVPHVGRLPREALALPVPHLGAEAQAFVVRVDGEDLEVLAVVAVAGAVEVGEHPSYGQTHGGVVVLALGLYVRAFPVRAPGRGKAGRCQQATSQPLKTQAYPRRHKSQNAYN